MKEEIGVNRNQIEFSEYWDKVSAAAFYKVVKITENASFADKILDKQRDELSACIRDEINRNFYDTKMRPKATVWLENLRKDFPNEASRFERYIKGCEITSKGYENILAIAAGGTAALTGAAIGTKNARKKNALASTLLIIGGVAAAGYKIASGLNVDAQALQKEVKKQFETWKASLLSILASCNDDADSTQSDDE